MGDLVFSSLPIFGANLLSGCKAARAFLGEPRLEFALFGSRTFRLLAPEIDDPRFMFTGVLLGDKFGCMKSNVPVCFEGLWLGRLN
jgi:hypothetical protein